MILDAGVFIALENPSQRRVVIKILEAIRTRDEPIRTTKPVLAQAWRDPARQVPMTRLVNSIGVLPFGDSQAVGLRCARSGTSDVVDADLATWAEALGETILTTDPDDMTKLGATHVSL